MKQLLSLLGFDVEKHSMRTEFVAGLTTFLTMSYILAVHPQMLSDAGMDKGALFSATAISAAVATLVMAFYAKLPFALAPAMGINAFFAYTLVITMGYTWQEALAAVLIEGIVFILLTIFKVREVIVNAIPQNLRYSISVGIGIFIAYIGLKNGEIIVASDSSMTTLGVWSATSVLAALGVLLGAILLSQNVRGALFYTIMIVTAVGVPLGVTHLPDDFAFISSPQSLAPIAFKFDFSRFVALDFNYYVVVFALLFMDLLDTLGTLVGTSASAGLVDSRIGENRSIGRALMADAVGTTFGAMCGTSTVTTFVESTTGVTEGGRTGLTSFWVAVWFILALFFSPLFLCIPGAATTSALVLVGVYMMRAVTKINLKDFTEALPSFVVMVTMPFTASISEGIVLGLISYVVIKACTFRFKEISPIMWILTVFFVLKYII